MTVTTLRGDALGLPDLDRLVLPETAAEAFREAGVPVDEAEANYIRLKPGTGAVVGYNLRGVSTTGRRVEVRGYARTFFEDYRARKIAGKWDEARRTPTELGSGFALMPSGRTVLFVFPNDQRLRNLPAVADPISLERILDGVEDLRDRRFRVSTLRPIRYKPQRRFIAATRLSSEQNKATEERRLFLRLFEDGRGARIEQTARLLRAQAGSSLLPDPVGTTLEGRLYVEEEIEAKSLLAAILDGRADPAELAEALLRFHACRASFAPAQQPDKLLSTLTEAFEMVTAVDESLGGAAREVINRLGAMLPDQRAPALLHGDVALHNILDSPNGMVIVDLERTAMGHPLTDVGQLRAHLRELSKKLPAAKSRIDGFAEGVIEAYRRAPEANGMEGLEFFTGYALANRAIGAVLRRGLENWWPSRAAELLRLALAATDGAASRQRRTFFTEEHRLPDGFRRGVFYPKRESLWAGFLRHPSGRRIYGVYDVGRDSFREVRPEDDVALPALSRWIKEGELVKYRPGRRAMIRIAQTAGRPAAYVKILPPAKATKVLRRWQAGEKVVAAAQPGAPRMPALLESWPDQGVMMLEALPGRSLQDLAEASESLGPGLEAIAQAVARLHGISGSRLDASTPRDSTGPRQYAEFVFEYFPERAPAYRRTLGEIERVAKPLTTTGNRVVHGDLYDGNVLLDGDRVALLDADLLHQGNPVEDVANFVAHLFLRAMQWGMGSEEGDRLGMLFLEAYRRAGGSAEVAEVRARGALVLFRLACLYQFRRHGQALTPALLNQAKAWASQSVAGEDGQRAELIAPAARSKTGVSL